jgi:hypothetical protein
METTEKIVESYCRYVKGWFTISNIKCSGQREIDLLAIDASSDKGLKRYHIESGVSISVAYSKLTAKPFSEEVLKQRTKQAGQRRTIGYFRDWKFNSSDVLLELKKFGFKKGNYSKIIVTWGWGEEAKRQADRAGIILWDFRRMIREIAEASHKKRTYFTDDTFRTIQLFVKALNDQTS